MLSKLFTRVLIGTQDQVLLVLFAGFTKDKLLQAHRLLAVVRAHHSRPHLLHTHLRRPLVQQGDPRASRHLQAEQRKEKVRIFLHYIITLDPHLLSNLD